MSKERYPCPGCGRHVLTTGAPPLRRYRVHRVLAWPSRADCAYGSKLLADDATPVWRPGDDG